MPLLFDATKLLALIASFIMLFGPKKLTNTEGVFILLSLSEVKYFVIGFLVIVLFYSRIFELIHAGYRQLNILTQCASALINRRSRWHAAYLVGSIGFFSLAIGIFFTSISQLAYTQARAASYLYDGNYTIIQRKLIKSVNQSIVAGTTSNAVTKLDNMIALFPDDTITTYAEDLRLKLNGLRKLSATLTQRGRDQLERGLLRSAAHSLEYAYLVDPDNDIARQLHEDLIESVDTGEIRESASQLKQICGADQAISNENNPDVRRALNPIRAYYVEDHGARFPLTIVSICERGIGNLIEHKRLGSQPPQTIVKGLIYYDSIDKYIADLQSSLRTYSRVHAERT